MNGLAAARHEKGKLYGILDGFWRNGFRMNYKRLDLNGLAPPSLASV